MFKQWMKRIAFLIVLSVGFGNYSTAQAQQEWCFDQYGQSVVEDFAVTTAEFARAHFTNYGRPRISYNRSLMDSLPTPMQHFVAAHECAHHHLGHLHPRGTRVFVAHDDHHHIHGISTSLAKKRELEADCWAVQKLVAHGIFSAHDVETVINQLNYRVRADETHLSGAERGRWVRQCANSAHQY